MVQPCRSAPTLSRIPSLSSLTNGGGIANFSAPLSQHSSSERFTSCKFRRICKKKGRALNKISAIRRTWPGCSSLKSGDKTNRSAEEKSSPAIRWAAYDTMLRGNLTCTYKGCCFSAAGWSTAPSAVTMAPVTVPPVAGAAAATMASSPSLVAGVPAAVAWSLVPQLQTCMTFFIRCPAWSPVPLCNLGVVPAAPWSPAWLLQPWRPSFLYFGHIHRSLLVACAAVAWLPAPLLGRAWEPDRIVSN